MSYQHLSATERTAIMYCRQYGLSHREIGRRLGRSHTTIVRELKRNDRISGSYWCQAADGFAKARRSTPRHAKRRSCQKLHDYVEQGLAQYWSPETISGRLLREFPQSSLLRVSPECIYQWIFANARSGGDWHTYLLRHHKRRKRQCRAAAACRSVIKDRIDISQRPAIVDSRKRVGDWEGDTIGGKTGTGVIATYVERKTGTLVAVKLTGKHAANLSQLSSEAFSALPARRLKTMTLDNGTEFADHKRLSELTGFDIYFAKPHSPWQRGCNENANGLLRQYFPKGSDFSAVTDAHVAAAVESLNNRPRKRFSYRTPNEMFG